VVEPLNENRGLVAEIATRPVVEREDEVEDHSAGGRQRDNCWRDDRERGDDDRGVERELYVAGAPPEALLRCGSSTRLGT